MNDEAELILPKTLVMVGMMGAGKTQVGRRVAKRLNVKFVDADEEIEAAANCSIEDIFAMHGEAAFRDGEQRVIERLLREPVHVLSTGGGAFMSPATRRTIAERGISVWLKADLDVLWQRVSRRGHRPMLNTENPRATLAQLVEERYGTYAKADITVVSDESPAERTAERVIDAVKAYLDAKEGKF